MASWFHIKSIIQFRINLLGLGGGIILKIVAFLVLNLSHLVFLAACHMKAVAKEVFLSTL